MDKEKYIEGLKKYIVMGFAIVFAIGVFIAYMAFAWYDAGKGEVLIMVVMVMTLGLTLYLVRGMLLEHIEIVPTVANPGEEEAEVKKGKKGKGKKGEE